MDAFGDAFAYELISNSKALLFSRKILEKNEEMLVLDLREMQTVKHGGAIVAQHCWNCCTA